MTEAVILAHKPHIPRKRSRDSDHENDSSEDSANLTGKLSKSCDYCKIKKVKCSGESPCQFCLKNNQSETCTYSLMKKPGLKRGYGKDMTQRMDYLEDLVSQLKDQIDGLQRFHKFSESYTSSPGTSIADPSLSIPHVRISPKAIQIPTLLNPSVTNSQNTMNPRIVINEEVPSLPVKSICLDLFKLFFDNIIPILPIVHPNMLDQLEKSLYHDTHPRLLVYAIVLISLKFFKNEVLLSQVEKDRIYGFCKEKVIQTSMKMIDLESLQSIALLAFDSLNNQANAPESWNFVSLATDYAMHLKLYDEKHHGIKTFLNAPNNNHHPISGVSPTLELPPISQLRRSSSSHSLNSLASIKGWNESDLRRNVYWCVYNIDKFYALSTLNDFKLPPTQCHLPFKLSSWFNNHDIEPSSPNFQFRTLQTHSANYHVYDSFADIIELNKILGDIHSFTKHLNSLTQYDLNQNTVHPVELKMQFKTLENNLMKWLSSLPTTTRSFIETASPTSPQKNMYQHPRDPFRSSLTATPQLEIYDILLFVQYYTAVIKLHSVIAYPNLTQLLNILQLGPQESINQCLQASLKTYQLLTDLVKLTGDESIFEKIGPVFGYSLFVNARILIIDLIYTFNFKPNTPQTIAVIESHSKVLQQYKSVLYKIGTFWKTSKIYFSIIQNIDLVQLFHVLQHNLASNLPTHQEFVTSLSGGNKLVYWINLLVPQIEKVMLKPGSTMIINPNRVQFAGNNALCYDEVWNLFISDSLGASS